MSFSLRPYQQEAVERVRQAFLSGHRAVLFVLPTGGGKTVVFSHIAEQAAARGNRIAVLVHRGPNCSIRPAAPSPPWGCAMA